MKLNIFEATKNATKRNLTVMDLQDRILKLQEEAGEIAAAYLQTEGKKPLKGKTMQDVQENLAEEAVDALLVVYSLIHVLGIDKSQLNHVAKHKLACWNEAADILRLANNNPY